MKIGIEVQRLFRKKKFGIESSSLELIKALKKAEPNHQFVIFAKDDEDRACLKPSDNLSVKTPGGRFFIDFEQFFLPLAAAREKVDILHCTGNTTPFFSPAPIVQTLHDVIFMDAIPSEDTFYQRFGNHYRRRVVPIVTPRSQAVITVSQYEKERIVQRLGIDRKKIQVIYNGLNQQRFHTGFPVSRQKEVQAKYRLPDQFILFLGNPSVRKNPGRVIEAYVKYVSATGRPLPLVTPGLPEKFVAQRLAELNFPFDHELFISPGYIDDEDLPVLYLLSRLFLFPSLSEGFGMPIIESMACGTPVITSSISCMPEIAGNAALLANPLDTGEMAHAIATYLQDEELRRKKIDAGFVNAKKFTWDAAAQNVLQIYDAVYEKSRKRYKTPKIVQNHAYVTRD